MRLSVTIRLGFGWDGVEGRVGVGEKRVGVGEKEGRRVGGRGEKGVG